MFIILKLSNTSLSANIKAVSRITTKTIIILWSCVEEERESNK